MLNRVLDMALMSEQAIRTGSSLCMVTATENDKDRASISEELFLEVISQIAYAPFRL